MRPAIKGISIGVVWLVGLGLMVLCDNKSVYIGPYPRETEKEERKDIGE